eukprot:4758091-Amphidinium_carterae.1
MLPLLPDVLPTQFCGHNNPGLPVHLTTTTDSESVHRQLEPSCSAKLGHDSPTAQRQCTEGTVTHEHDWSSNKANSSRSQRPTLSPIPPPAVQQPT